MTDRVVGMISNLNWRAYGMLLVLIVVGIIFQISTEGIFLSPRNLALLFRQASILTIVASGVALLLLMGEVDLSIGSAVYLSALAAAMAQVNWGMPTSIAVLVALGAGLMLGAWQGFWVIWLKVPSFVVTLAGLLAFRGLGYMWSNAATVAPMNNSFVNISEFFIPRSVSLFLIGVTWLLVLTMTFRSWRTSRKQLANTRGGWTVMAGRVAVSAALAALLAYMAGGFLGIPMAVVVALGVTVILTVVAGNTRFGRHLYAIGGSRSAAYLSGININGSVLLVFLIMGLVYGLAGILAAARLNAVAPSTGNYLELEAIAAAVIGGVSLSGGIGSIHGAVVGALLLTSIDNGLSLLNVSSFLQLVTKAQLLLFAVWFDVATRDRER